jgi:hypothetical protein
MLSAMVQNPVSRRHHESSKKRTNVPSSLPSALHSRAHYPYLLPSPTEMVTHPRLRLDTLTVELLFEIIEQMDLQDALRFRLVSKHMSDVVLQAPSILRKLLRHVKVPLPYSPRPIQTLLAKEVISLCRRAFALQANWNRQLDRVRAHSFFPLQRSYMVAVVPGGRYLVTAHHSTSGTEHSIGLYDLEHEQGITCVGSCPTGTSLQILNAAWMQSKGQQGVVITWVREKSLKKTATRSP